MNPQAQAQPAAPPGVAPAPTAPLQGNPVAGTPTTPGALPAVPQYNTNAAMDTIRQFYQIPGATAAITGQQKANAYNAQTAFENSQNQKQLQASRLQDKLDPSKYHIQNTDQGTKITDPTGQQVDLGTYVNLTGANPADVLKNSTDPKEQNFVQDFNNYQSLMQAMVTKDTNKESAAVYDDYIQANPALANMTPQQVRRSFMSQYGQYFGQPQQGQGPQYQGGFTPQNDTNTLRYLYEYALKQNPSSSFGVDLGSLAPQAK